MRETKAKSEIATNQQKELEKTKKKSFRLLQQIGLPGITTYSGDI